MVGSDMAVVACSWFLAKAGVVSIMEMLQQHDATLCSAALDLLLTVVSDDAPVLESLCLVGVVPIATQLTAKSAPGGRPTRARAAKFVELLCSTSGHTVQMFVACGGLAVLVEVCPMPFSRVLAAGHVLSNRAMVGTVATCNSLCIPRGFRKRGGMK